MKRNLCIIAMLFCMLAANAGNVKLVLSSSPTMAGIVKIQPDGFVYFDIESVDTSMQFKITDNTGAEVGTASFDEDYFAGYSGYIKTGGLKWTVFTPGTYTIHIPADSFFFTWDEERDGNEETTATVTVNNSTHIVATTTLTAEEVHYVSQLEGLEITFEGAEKVETGSEASVSFSNYDPEDDLNCGACGSCNVNFGGKISTDGNKVVLHNIEDYFSDEYPIQNLTLTVNPVPASMINAGKHGFIFDGVDLDAELVFHLRSTTDGIGNPTYKVTVEQNYDLQGRPVGNNFKGIVIREGKKVLNK